jgi:hypothetical protein
LDGNLISNHLTLSIQAPEVMTQKPYDTKADVYSFALILWELITNKVPFENLDMMGVLMKVGMNGERPEIPMSDSRLPNELLDLIKICWNQDPTKRPTFGEVIEAFEALETKFIPNVPEQPGFVKPVSSLASSRNSCSICFDQPKQIVFEPCYHLTCCAQCSNGISSCPICRQDIKTKRQVFIS